MRCCLNGNMSELLSFEVEDKVYNGGTEYVLITLHLTRQYAIFLFSARSWPGLARINSRTKTFIINLNVHVQLEF